MLSARDVARALSRRLRRADRRPVEWGELDRLTPISNVFGFDRGTPIDRHFIARFLERRSERIRGRVLEVGDREYTTRFGGDRVSESDVLVPPPGGPAATVVADLMDSGSLPIETFDCILLTQVLQFVPDMPAAILNVNAALRPGGSVLATFTGISQISRFDMDRWGDWWRVTSLSAHALFARAFPAEGIDLTTHGNVKLAAAFLHGLSAEEMRPVDLEYADPDYELVITVCATKPASIE